MRSSRRTPRRLAQVGGGVALLLSIAFSVALIVGGEGLNPLNGVTLLAGVIGGATAMIWADKPLVLVLAGVAITLASVPALIGGVGLLFIACAVAIEVAAVWQRSG